MKKVLGAVGWLGRCPPENELFPIELDWLHVSRKRRIHLATKYVMSSEVRVSTGVLHNGDEMILPLLHRIKALSAETNHKISGTEYIIVCTSFRSSNYIQGRGNRRIYCQLNPYLLISQFRLLLPSTSLPAKFGSFAGLDDQIDNINPLLSEACFGCLLKLLRCPNQIPSASAGFSYPTSHPNDVLLRPP